MLEFPGHFVLVVFLSQVVDLAASFQHQDSQAGTAQFLGCHAAGCAGTNNDAIVDGLRHAASTLRMRFMLDTSVGNFKPRTSLARALAKFLPSLTVGLLNNRPRRNFDGALWGAGARGVCDKFVG